MRRHTGYGWLELVVSVLLIVLSIFTLINPGLALSSLVFLYGIMALMTGIEDIVLYIRVARFTGFGPIVALISGILSAMSGVMLLVYPDAGRLVLSMLFPIWFIAHCVARLAHLSAIRALAGRGVYWLTLAVNVLGIIMGVMMIVHPMLAIISTSYIIGLYLLLLGIDGVIMACSRMGR